MRSLFFPRLSVFTFALGAALTLSSATRAVAAESATAQPVPASSAFEMTDLVGAWYEVARIGTVKNALCGDATATFAATDKTPNELEVTYARDCPIGGLASISATLKATDASEAARLSLTYREDLGRDHFISVIAQDPENQWLVMGSDDRSELYIYSRTATLDHGLLTKLVALGDAEWGFADLQSRMSCTPQSTAVYAPGASCQDVIGR